jgi:hypothetical protein
MTMSSERKTVCVLIDRRSTLAIVLMFMITYSTEIAVTFGCVAGTVATFYYQWASAMHLEEQLRAMQHTSQELLSEMVMMQQEMHLLKERLPQERYLVHGTTAAMSHFSCETDAFWSHDAHGSRYLQSETDVADLVG